MEKIKIKPKQLVNYLTELDIDNYGGKLYDGYTTPEYYFKYTEGRYDDYIASTEREYTYELGSIMNEYLDDHLIKTNKELANEIRIDMLEPEELNYYIDNNIDEDLSDKDKIKQLIDENIHMNIPYRYDYYDFFDMINPLIIKITPSIEEALKKAFNVDTIEEVIKKHPYLYPMSDMQNTKEIQNAILIRPEKINEDDFLFLNKIETLELTKKEIVQLSTDEMITESNYTSNFILNEFILIINDNILLSLSDNQISKLIPFNDNIKKEMIKYKLIDNNDRLDKYLSELSKISYTYIKNNSLYKLLNKIPNEHKITPIIKEYTYYINLEPLYVNKTYEDTVTILEKYITDSDLKKLEHILSQEEL